MNETTQRMNFQPLENLSSAGSTSPDLNILAHVLHGYIVKKCFRALETTDNE